MVVAEGWVAVTDEDRVGRGDADAFLKKGELRVEAKSPNDNAIAHAVTALVPWSDGAAHDSSRHAFAAVQGGGGGGCD